MVNHTSKGLPVLGKKTLEALLEEWKREGDNDTAFYDKKFLEISKEDAVLGDFFYRLIQEGYLECAIINMVIYTALARQNESYKMEKEFE